jgi:signal transduction histidine kinase
MWAPTLVAGVVGICLPLLHRLRLPMDVIAVSGSLIMIALQVGHIYSEGQHSWAHAWLVAAPLIGHNVGGARAGMWSAILAILALWGTCLARVYGVFPAVADTLGVSVFSGAVDLSILLIIIYVLGVIPVRSADRARARLAEANVSLQGEVEQHLETQSALHEAQSQLLRTARFAGMAEVATGVLHNMGNALNTVAVTARLARDTAEDDSLQRRLERTVDLLADPNADREAIQRYLSAVARRVHSRREQSVAELDRLMDGVAHVESVVSAQQRHARSGGLVEDTPVRTMVNQAVALARPIIEQLGVRVEATYIQNINVITEVHQVIQILVNLVRNAADAMRDLDAERIIHIDAELVGSAVRLVVRDSGPGVPADQRERIFQHGYTTKSTGNGFGLHVSALAARSLGGELALLPHVDGIGARFVLFIPLDGADARFTSEPGVRSAATLGDIQLTSEERAKALLRRRTRATPPT